MHVDTATVLREQFPALVQESKENVVEMYENSSIPEYLETADKKLADFRERPLVSRSLVIAGGILGMLALPCHSLSWIPHMLKRCGEYLQPRLLNVCRLYSSTFLLLLTQATLVLGILCLMSPTLLAWFCETSIGTWVYKSYMPSVYFLVYFACKLYVGFHAQIVALCARYGILREFNNLGYAPYELEEDNDSSDSGSDCSFVS
jgi:hypothetical protein